MCTGGFGIQDKSFFCLLAYRQRLGSITTIFQKNNERKKRKRNHEAAADFSLSQVNQAFGARFSRDERAFHRVI
jgi:ABC-type lipopolysaccharide export system ATPase subunit